MAIRPKHGTFYDGTAALNKCGQHLRCNERYPGRQLQCPACQHLNFVTEVPGHAAQFNPESGMTLATYIHSSMLRLHRRPSGEPNPNPAAAAF